MESNSDYVDLQTGMDVFSRDGDKVGTVVSLDDTQLTVEKGFIFHQDVVIPMNAVESADDRSIYLNVTKDEALSQTWGNGAMSTRTVDTARDTVSRDASLGVEGMATQTGVADMSVRSGSDKAASTTSRDDTMIIPVHEEELTATKRAVDAGQVEINTKVVSEDRTLHVPITEERVRVTRRVVDRDAIGADAAFKGGTIDVPVRTEEVDLQKRVRVAEEVEVAKEAVQKTQQVSGTVRREVVDVADNTTSKVIDDASGTSAKDSRN